MEGRRRGIGGSEHGGRTRVPTAIEEDMSGAELRDARRIRQLVIYDSVHVSSYGVGHETGIASRALYIVI